jgi:hypothetical protein
MVKAYHMTIDPGASGSGWALWSEGWELLKNGVVLPPKSDEWEQQAYYTVGHLRDVAKKSGAEAGYVEFPAFFQAHGAGVASSGALVKLAWFVGLVCGKMPMYVELVTVGEWKGQLPKRIVEDRIRKILPGVRAKSHDWDAIGIGLYKAGRF